MVLVYVCGVWWSDEEGDAVRWTDTLATPGGAGYVREKPKMDAIAGMVEVLARISPQMAVKVETFPQWLGWTPGTGCVELREAVEQMEAGWRAGVRKDLTTLVAACKNVSLPDLRSFTWSVGSQFLQVYREQRNALADLLGEKAASEGSLDTMVSDGEARAAAFLGHASVRAFREAGGADFVDALIDHSVFHKCALLDQLRPGRASDHSRDCEGVALRQPRTLFVAGVCSAGIGDLLGGHISSLLDGMAAAVPVLIEKAHPVLLFLEANLFAWDASIFPEEAQDPEETANGTATGTAFRAVYYPTMHVGFGDAGNLLYRLPLDLQDVIANHNGNPTGTGNDTRDCACPTNCIEGEASPVVAFGVSHAKLQDVLHEHLGDVRDLTYGMVPGSRSQLLATSISPAYWAEMQDSQEKRLEIQRLVFHAMFRLIPDIVRYVDYTWDVVFGSYTGPVLGVHLRFGDILFIQGSLSDEQEMAVQKFVDTTKRQILETEAELQTTLGIPRDQTILWYLATDTIQVREALMQDPQVGHKVRGIPADVLGSVGHTMGGATDPARLVEFTQTALTDILMLSRTTCVVASKFSGFGHLAYMMSSLDRPGCFRGTLSRYKG